VFEDDPTTPSPVLVAICATVMDDPGPHSDDLGPGGHIIIDSKMHKGPCFLLVVASPEVGTVLQVAPEAKVNTELPVDAIDPSPALFRVVQRVILAPARRPWVINSGSRIQIDGRPSSVSQSREEPAVQHDPSPFQTA
jgi:hypothetical protein